jgi:hypothetical protein
MIGEAVIQKIMGQRLDPRARGLLDRYRQGTTVAVAGCFAMKLKGSGLESLWSMPKPLETSAKLHDVSVSQEILSIGHLDKKSRDDLQRWSNRSLRSGVWRRP